MPTPNTQIDPSMGSPSDIDPPTTQALNRQGDIEFFRAAQNLSIGTVTTTIVSGNCTYNVTVVNNNGSTKSEDHDNPEVPLQEIIAWLKGPKFLHIYEEALSQRLSNTGTWFIESEEFRQLVEGRDVIVWGTGMPGAGKTVISSFSMERLKQIFEAEEGVAIVGAYIRYTERPATRDIFAGLIAQLVEDYPCAYSYIRHIYIRRQKKALNEAGMIKAFENLVGLFSKVFLIIDGLDEADDNVKDALLRVLPSLGANVLITSRPLDLYEHRLPGALHVSIEARTEDLDHFVEETVKSSSKLQAILRGDPDLIKQLKARVRETSKGMFLVARLQMEDVLDKARSVGSLLKTLNQLPSGVEDMYRHSLLRINAQSADDVSSAHRVFTWLLHSARDLAAGELQEALAVSFEDKTYDSIDVIPISMILSMCGGFVTVEKRGKKDKSRSQGKNLKKSHVRFIHYTAHEFLKSVKFPDVPSPHTYLAVTCLVYLRQNEEELHDWVVVTWEDLEPYDFDCEVTTFLGYAEENWGHHASISQGHGPLHPFIQTFLIGCKSRNPTSLHLAASYGLVEVVNASLPTYDRVSARKPNGITYYTPTVVRPIANDRTVAYTPPADPAWGAVTAPVLDQTTAQTWQWGTPSMINQPPTTGYNSSALPPANGYASGAWPTPPASQSAPLNGAFYGWTTPPVLPPLAPATRRYPQQQQSTEFNNGMNGAPNGVPGTPSPRRRAIGYNGYRFSRIVDSTGTEGSPNMMRNGQSTEMAH
ncbi:hypothetical protein DFP72DRAFT_942612 [Ephemerocybe angulata]|uniref:NACHT domain-containing protein n=1 Tax=Ephemerocybe angulata TaxID=980116 RepID=A0A8H6LUT9_9AGAR|nr:hypothetical protein DFP72DRAFT_942612 [Tulosesus angulatus]